MSDTSFRQNLIFLYELEELLVEIICLIFEYLPEIFHPEFKQTSKESHLNQHFPRKDYEKVSKIW